MPRFLICVLGVKLRSWCFQGKHFTEWPSYISRSGWVNRNTSERPECACAVALPSTDSTHGFPPYKTVYYVLAPSWETWKILEQTVSLLGRNFSKDQGPQVSERNQHRMFTVILASGISLSIATNAVTGHGNRKPQEQATLVWAYSPLPSRRRSTQESHWYLTPTF